MAIDATVLDRMRQVDEDLNVQAETKATNSTSFLSFTRYTKPDYLVGWFHEELHEALDRFLHAVVNQESPRLLIQAPPRHGKSEATSRRFPAYALGRYPWLEIILWSYAADLAEDMNEDVQGIMDSAEYRRVFPDVEIPAPGKGTSGSKRNRKETQIIGHPGVLRAAGVGGGVTGKGAHILLIDDPFKDDQEAGSEATRNKVWNRYASTAYTRLAPGGGVLIIQTRWHEDDLAGRVEERSAQAASGDDPDADVFEIVKYPAIAEEDEKHRKAGEALHPARYPVPALNRIKNTIGSYFWSALFQQSPSPAGGDIFRTEWWRYWRELPKMMMVVIFADTAMKAKERSDYSVFQVWGLSADRQIYLLDQIRDKWESPDLEREARAFWAKWSAMPMPGVPAPSKLAIEDKASGTGLIQSLQRSRGGQPSIPVVGIPREVDKVVRARSGAPSIEAGNVWIPDPEAHPTPWLSDYMAEFASFTAAMSHAHDDQIDPTLDAIHQLLLGDMDFYSGAL